LRIGSEQRNRTRAREEGARGAGRTRPNQQISPRKLFGHNFSNRHGFAAPIGERSQAIFGLKLIA
jgi:hypothetical protein